MYLSNARGNMYSFGHETLDKYSREFWSFSYEQFRLDVKANLGYVFERSGGKKAHFICTSNGAVAYLSAITDPLKSWRGEAEAIMEKVHAAYCLAPVVFTVRLNPTPHHLNLI